MKLQRVSLENNMSESNANSTKEVLTSITRMFDDPNMVPHVNSTGIAHKVVTKATTVHKCGKRVTPTKCSEDHLNIYDSGGSYCQMCYRNSNPGLTTAQRRAQCKTSILGCVKCKEPICKECWDKGYNNHPK